MPMHTLLFVDDEVDIVDSSHRSFRKGYRTLKATSGAEAIKIIAEEAVDLIICDQRMPEISGDQVLKYALEQQPQAIRILLTGYADTASLMRCINEAQIYKYISKPWEPEMLRLTVVRALESQDLSKQKQLVTTALTQYVSSKVVEQIMADPSRLQLGGELKARIGLHTGEVVVGNMGSKMRFDYSILGDAANLASRLESANKIFGTGIMVSEATWLQAGGDSDFIGRELGMIKVVGRNAPVRVFELRSQAGATEFLDLDAYQKTLDLCRSGLWIDAEAAFNNWPEDPVCQAYVKQCRKAQEQGGWDGVWLMDNK